MTIVVDDGMPVRRLIADDAKNLEMVSRIGPGQEPKPEGKKHKDQGGDPAGNHFFR